MEAFKEEAKKDREAERQRQIEADQKREEMWMQHMDKQSTNLVNLMKCMPGGGPDPSATGSSSVSGGGATVTADFTARKAYVDTHWKAADVESWKDCASWDALQAELMKCTKATAVAIGHRTRGWDDLTATALTRLPKADTVTLLLNYLKVQP